MRTYRCSCSKLLSFALTASCPHCVDVKAAFPMSTNMSNKKRQPHTWVVDSGASVHCIGDASMLTTFYENHPPVHIKVADKRIVTAHAVGTAVVTMVDLQGRSHSITLHNVVYHPSFHTNLMSVRRLWRDNRIGAREPSPCTH